MQRVLEAWWSLRAFHGRLGKGKLMGKCVCGKCVCVCGGVRKHISYDLSPESKKQCSLPGVGVGEMLR